MFSEAALAREIAVELGLPPQPVRGIVGSGSVNHVFVIGSGAGRWVIRFARDPRRDHVFEAEAWSATQAAGRGVPTPVVIAFGELHGVPYGVQRFVAGGSVTGDTQPPAWTSLGEYAQMINPIPPDPSAPATLFTRFGRDLESAWSRHLSYNLEQLDAHDSLVREGLVTTEQQQRLRDTVLELAEVPLRFGLGHGDLTPRNLVQPAEGPLVLIDWGSATFGPVPWVDLVHIDRDAQVSGTDATRRLDAFLDGMGLDLMTIRPTFEKFRLLQLLDLVRWATERRPDRLRGAIDDLRAVL